MIKIMKYLNVKQATALIRRMPVRDRIKLLLQLDKKTWVQEMKDILKTIKQRRKTGKLSAREIAEEIERGRRDFHARRR